MKININKGTIASLLTGATLILTGCSTYQDNNMKKEVAAGNNAVTSQLDDTVTTTTTTTTVTNVTTTAKTNNKPSTNSTTTTTATSKNEDAVVTSTTKKEASNPVEQTSEVATDAVVYQTTTTTTKAENKEKTMDDANEQKTKITAPDFVVDYNNYQYVDTTMDYVIKEDDCPMVMETLVERFHTTRSAIFEANKTGMLAVSPGDIVKIPVKDEYISARAGEDVKGIAACHGIDEKELLELNGMSENDTILKEDTLVKLHRYYGNENSYKTGIGTVNVINNNRIMGENVLYAHGYMGASQRVLSKCSSLSGTSAATFYLFDGANNIIDAKIICSNPKKIDTINGIPVAYLRTEKDLEDLASTYNVELDDTARMQWESVNYENYTVHVTDDDEQFITFDGRILDGYNLMSNIEYHNDENENTTESNKQLIK